MGKNPDPYMNQRLRPPTVRVGIRRPTTYTGKGWAESPKAWGAPRGATIKNSLMPARAKPFVRGGHQTVTHSNGQRVGEPGPPTWRWP
ncbi:hypothetical protein GCM10009850_053540 [Nonomuraea monospora]|uniref:Uncharacterized protein n=1 Tax=Nonomuraea monospora TaxID=568818 RepID=A0ABP5PDR9_9ACTN